MITANQIVEGRLNEAIKDAAQYGWEGDPLGFANYLITLKHMLLADMDMVDIGQVPYYLKDKETT